MIYRKNFFQAYPNIWLSEAILMIIFLFRIWSFLYGAISIWPSSDSVIYEKTET